jgi:NADP-dependent 3-hydroxy acid dehydrogenase YdfG
MDRLLAELQQRFPQRRAVITGAASGLGFALASRLASGGWHIGLIDLNADALAQASKTLEEQAASTQSFALDVRDDEALSDAIMAFAEAHQGIDMMINNAGVAAGGMIEQTSVEDWRWVLEINVTAVATGCRAVAPMMRKQGDGAIINIASAAGFISAPGMSAYCASKAAVVSLSETLFAELTPDGPSVTVAMPSFFQTNLVSTMRGPKNAVAFADRMMSKSNYSAEFAAEDILDGAVERKLYLPLPKSLGRFWRFKRWLPMVFLRKLAAQRPPSGD